MARTTNLAVQGLLGRDYDGRRPTQVFVDTANSVVTQVVACETRKSVTTRTATDLELMERWLAAYFYTLNDPIYTSKSTGGASGAFVSDPVDPQRYRAGALALDFWGCLSSILNRKRASASWGGRAPSEQTDYVDRD